MSIMNSIRRPRGFYYCLSTKLSTTLSLDLNLITTSVLRQSIMLNIIRTKKIGPAAVRPLVRTPIRIYKPGEELPKPGQKYKTNQQQIDRGNRSVQDATVGNAPSTSSVLFSKIMSEIFQNRRRKLIALEGAKLVEEALKTGNKLEQLFILKSQEVPNVIKDLINKDTEIHRVSESRMAPWSSVTTPPGVIGICKKPNSLQVPLVTNPETSQGQQCQQPFPVTVICDNLREPGNLGSILRSAAGAGCKKILLSKGCVDVWDTKTIRSGCGAHFYIPIITDIPISSLGNYIHESDNVKTSETHEQIDNAKIKATGIFLADSNTTDSRSTLPICPYTDINYRNFDEIYIIMGGETEGLADETLRITNELRSRVQFSSTSQLKRINIPLRNHFDSLNSANAFGIILFEIVRQLKLDLK